MAHCHREAFHAQWEILLDAEFCEAWVHGILVQCYDGVMRRIYPRIFTYSADYPEKYVCILRSFVLMTSMHLLQSSHCLNSQQWPLSLPTMPCPKVRYSKDGNTP